MKSAGMFKGELTSGGDGRTYFKLSSEGYKYAENLVAKNETSKKCFIAMSYDKELLSQFEEHVIPRIQETGFHPVLVKDVAFNDSIIDRIIYEIKSSKFVIADFSQLKGGVYYEAGLAIGYGLEVIHTVNEKDLKELHFDTRNTNHIVWEDAKKLGVEIRDRILATIPGANVNL
jgi:precorrin isomerase